MLDSILAGTWWVLQHIVYTTLLTFKVTAASSFKHTVLMIRNALCVFIFAPQSSIQQHVKTTSDTSISNHSSKACVLTACKQKLIDNVICDVFSFCLCMMPSSNWLGTDKAQSNCVCIHCFCWVMSSVRSISYFLCVCWCLTVVFALMLVCLSTRCMAQFIVYQRCTYSLQSGTCPSCNYDITIVHDSPLYCVWMFFGVCWLAVVTLFRLSTCALWLFLAFILCMQTMFHWCLVYMYTWATWASFFFHNPIDYISQHAQSFGAAFSRLCYCWFCCLWLVFHVF